MLEVSAFLGAGSSFHLKLASPMGKVNVRREIFNASEPNRDRSHSAERGTRRLSPFVLR